jgi:hypothetical protein
LIACRNCSLPAPWGDAPPITFSSKPSDYASGHGEYYDSDDYTADFDANPYDEALLQRELLASLPPELQVMMSRMGHSTSSEEEQERTMNHGFTEDEAYDLLCQGVKPWDDDAADILAYLG